MKVLFEVFQKLAEERWTGEVQVSASQGNAFVVIYEGQFLYSYRPFDRAVERFQKIEWMRLPEDVRMEKCNSWEDVLKLLMRANQNHSDKLVRYLKTDRLELFFRIFFWTNVEIFPRAFSFDPNLSPELNFYGPKELSKILKEAKHRLEEWPKIQRRIGSSKRLFISRIPTRNTGAQKRPDSIDKALKAFDPKLAVLDEVGPYSEEQMQILQLCDGRNSVQDIIRQSPDGEFLILRRLIELWDRELIVPKEGESALDPLGTRPRFFWFESFQLLCMILVISSLFAFNFPWDYSLQRNNAQLEKLQSALELFRAQQGVYPTSVEEIKRAGFVSSNAWSQIEYRLTSPKSYELKYRNSLLLAD